MTGFDAATMREAFAGPENQWVSYGTVDADNQDARSVNFDPDLGPMITVTLHPSARVVPCRVLSSCAGNGEGEYYPFIAGDEVVVLIPEGDERAGCVIVGRVNQQIDRFPRNVAGQPVTNNNVGFKRTRTPFIWETASSLLFYQATTNAFITIEDVGNVTVSAGDQSFMHVGYDFLGFQNADASLLLQGAALGGDTSNRGWLMQAGGANDSDIAMLKIGLKGSYFTSTQPLTIAANGEGSGTGGLWHAVSFESVLNMLIQLMGAIGILGVPTGLAAWDPGTDTDGSVRGAALITALGLAATLPIPATLLTGIVGVLSTQTKVASIKPGIASSGLLIG